MRRVNWFSSLPDKYCNEIKARVKQLAEIDGNSNYQKDYRIILRITEDNKSPVLKVLPIKKKVKHEVTIPMPSKLRKLLGTPITPTEIPSFEQAKFRMPQKMFSRA